MLKLILFLCAASVFAMAPQPVRGKSGMVASDQPLASQAGLEILKKGGNAFDAAVATALALGVTNPHSSGIGGGDFIHYYKAGYKNPQVIDCREEAPAKVTVGHYQRNGKHDTKLSQVGGLAVAIPGELKGLYLLHKKHGMLPWPKVVEPSLKLAKDGFKVNFYLAKILKKFKTRFIQYPGLKEIFYPSGTALKHGDLLKNPDMAKTLALISKKGPDGFYKGKVAKAIIKAVQDSGGVLSQQDLDNISPRELKPYHTNYRGYDVYSMPSPSSGGLVLLQMLEVLENYPLKQWGLNSSKSIHAIVEAMKHAYANRAEFMGDDRFVKIPVQELLNPDYIQSIVKSRNDKKTHPHFNYGLKKGTKFLPDDKGTTHFCVYDRYGNAVSVTATINTFFGSKLVVPGYGIVLNNEMDDFSLAPGIPNAYGLIGSHANVPEPGKKPLSSMTPTIILKEGKPFALLGGSGGPRIISGVLQVLLKMIDYGLDAQAAVNSPRFHHQWTPDVLFIEEEIPLDVRSNLIKRGHLVRPLKARNVIQAIRITSEYLEGAADPRKHGRPAGY